MKKIILIMHIVFIFNLNASEDIFETALKEYKKENYEMSFYIFKEEEKKNNKLALYYLAKMYENGYFVKKNKTKALKYYKEFSNYSNEEIEKEVENESEITKNIDIFKKTNIKAKKTFDKFVINPYRANYIVPFSYRTNGKYQSYSLSDKYTNIEAEIQISLKIDLFKNIFGLNEIYSVSYTQNSWWQIYVDSSPFRETNHKPEFEISVPVKTNYKLLNYLKRIKYKIAHNSNGQGNITTNTIMASKYNLENRSRSYNYMEADFLFEYKHLFLDLGINFPFLGNKDLTDNKDLYDYIGYNKLKLIYINSNIYTMLKLNGNFLTGKYGIEFSNYYNVNKEKNVHLFFKIFTGYGESLIDYNNRLTKIGIGISFNTPNIF